MTQTDAHTRACTHTYKAGVLGSPMEKPRHRSSACLLYRAERGGRLLLSAEQGDEVIAYR